MAFPRAISCVLLMGLSTILTVCGTSSASGDPVHLGAYALKKVTDEYKAVLKDMGYDEATQTQIEGSTAIALQVILKDDKYIVGLSFTLCEKVDIAEANKASGEEFNLHLCDGRVVKAKIDYDPVRKVVTRTLAMPDFEARLIVTDITKDGLKVHCRAKEKEADLEFTAIAINKSH